ncbi:MAG: transcriptional repressor LexA [Phycisphaeraceae bacterium]|nr:transcriptional repressor LexA [Phycisphaeraceae bacterium]
MTLTPKQLEVLTRIRDLRLTRGYSPTMQELADELGVSKVTIFERVEALIRKGALKRSAHKARSLEISPRFLAPDEVEDDRIPLVGRIAAGRPIEAIEQRRFLDLSELFGPQGRVKKTGRKIFALEVSGDSMVGDGIFDGDYVICEQADTARNGQTVVALIEGEEATLKRFYREKSGIRLQPANEAYEPIFVDDCQIQGIVVGLVRAHF